MVSERRGVKPKVLLVTTGGTITMLRNEQGSLSPCENASALLEKIPELKTLADVDILPLVNMDSSNFTPDLWIAIAKAIFQRFKEYDGFVIAHGTDTLCYTAAALSFMIQELNKPVIITGAQVPLEDIGSDGRANLINAFRVAILIWQRLRLCLVHKIIRGTRAKKCLLLICRPFVSG